MTTAIIRHLGLFALLATQCLAVAPSSAENGNAQAIMALIVLPNEQNIAAEGPKRDMNTYYNGDTLLSSLQKSGLQTFKVWIAI